jgi:hypothetical protein
MSNIIYQASQARIDDLLREGADRRRAHEIRRALDVSRMLRQPQRRLGRLGRVVRAANPRAAAGPSGLPAKCAAVSDLESSTMGSGA